MNQLFAKHASMVLVGTIIILMNALPWWFIVMLSALLASRLYLLKYRTKKVNLVSVNIAAAIILAGLLFSVRQSGMLNLMLQILILAACCRLLLLTKTAEQQQLLWVQYFLLACCFILHQDMLYTLLIFMLLLLNIYSHYRLYAPVGAQLNWRSLLQSMVLITPLWIGVFLLFPRLPPFWQIPTLRVSTTGLGDIIDAGSIEQLVQNDALAFRVEFDNNRPSQEELYWRAKIYEDFDGRRWQLNRLRNNNQPQPPQWTVKTAQVAPTDYRIIAEASQQRVLFALASPVSNSNNVSLISSGLVAAPKLLSQRLSYQISSVAKPVLLLSDDERRRNLDTANGNPATKKFAQQLYAQYPSPAAMVGALTEHFRQQPFFYSLTPPKLGVNSIDQFLFETKTGFCSHYASATALLLRSAGIAARVVGGYQGGTWYPQQGYLEVSQREAHAWVEYLDQGRWLRFDPTAAVAPERIMQDLSAALSNDQRSLLFNGWQQFSWLQNLRQQWRHADYYWSTWVLAFDENQQIQLWQRIKQQAVLFSLLPVALLSLLIFGFYWQSRQRHYKTMPRATATLVKRLPALLSTKPPSMSISGYLQRLSEQHAVYQTALEQIRHCYELALYKDDVAALSQLSAILRSHRQLLRQLRRSIKNA